MFYQTNRMQAAERAEKCHFYLVTLIFVPDLQTRPSDMTKHVFHVNLAQIRSAVPDIFHTQTKTQTDGAKNTTFNSSLHTVMINNF